MGANRMTGTPWHVEAKSSKDRLNYGEVLMPPVGYWVERAVGTTYSLDIERCSKWQELS